MRVHTKKVSKLADATFNLVLPKFDADDHPAKAARTEVSTGTGEAREGFVVGVADDRFDELDRERVRSIGLGHDGLEIGHGG